MFLWIKELKHIIYHYRSDLNTAHKRIKELEKLIQDRTTVAVDVHFKSANHVIVIGSYKNNDYINSYSLDTSDLAALIEHLRRLERTGTIRRIDTIPSFQAVFKRELDTY